MTSLVRPAIGFRAGFGFISTTGAAQEIGLRPSFSADRLISARLGEVAADYVIGEKTGHGPLGNPAGHNSDADRGYLPRGSSSYRPGGLSPVCVRADVNHRTFEFGTSLHNCLQGSLHNCLQGQRNRGILRCLCKREIHLLHGQPGWTAQSKACTETSPL